MYACIKCWFRHMMFESNFLTDPNSKIFIFRDSFNICTITSGDNLIIVNGIFLFSENHKFGCICIKNQFVITECNL